MEARARDQTFEGEGNGWVADFKPAFVWVGLRLCSQSTWCCNAEILAHGRVNGRGRGLLALRDRRRKQMVRLATWGRWTWVASNLILLSTALHDNVRPIVETDSCTGLPSDPFLTTPQSIREVMHELGIQHGRAD